MGAVVLKVCLLVVGILAQRRLNAAFQSGTKLRSLGFG